MYNYLLTLHIISGSLSCIIGVIPLITKKGGTRHKFYGKIFHYSLVIASVSSIIISLMKGLEFLLLLGLFTVYMLVQGRRSLGLLRESPKVYDYVLSIMAIISGILLFIVSNGFLGTFGLLFIVFAIVDILKYQNYIKSNWMNNHIARMMGAYISSVTAFLVVNLSGELNQIFVWLSPTVIGTIIIIYFIRKLRSNLSRV